MARKTLIVTAQQLAGYRAAYSRLVKSLEKTPAEDHDAIETRIAELANMIKRAKVDEGSKARQSISALTAHVTRLSKQLKGKRGKVRDAMKVKLAGYEGRIAELQAA